MKQSKLVSVYVVLLALTSALGLFGCHTTEEKESTLSAAGFRTMTPTTPQQQAVYDSLPDKKVQRIEKDGKVTYAYADKKSGVVYVGGENQYQRYKELGVQQQIANDQLEAAQMNQNAAMSWGAWGPRGWW